MGDENPIRTLRDYSKPSHEGYRNSIELPVGNNVDPNQHLKDFLKLVDSLDLDGKNRERMRLRLSNWLECLPNPKLSTYPVLSARSYPTEDPQCSTHVHGSINAIIIHPKQQSDSRDNRTEENEEEETKNAENIHVNPPTPPDPSVSFITEKVLKLNSFFESLRFARSDDEVVFRMPQRTKEVDLVSPLEKDKFESFFVESLKVRKMGFKHVLEKRKGYYKACTNLGRTYKRDKERIEKLKINHVIFDKKKLGSS
ncbi:hypothetical protein Tco_1125351 [Tanacetum coccineum]|uniref:MAK10-like protein n=1 Tax=Tanacetum coccineum TaxID=301880 RepID=A0ABQ5J8S3_9ASTR